MNDFDKVVMVYRYFFYNEVYYKDKISKIEKTCKSNHATYDDYIRLIKAHIEYDTFSKIMTDILKSFDPRHFD